MSLSTTELEKIATMLRSDDLTFIKSGIGLVEMLIYDEDNFRELIDIIGHAECGIALKDNTLTLLPLDDRRGIECRQYLQVWTTGVLSQWNDVISQQQTTLHLHEWGLNEIPSEIRHLSHLETLSIKHDPWSYKTAYFEAIPNHIFSISSLKRLDFTSSRLTEIPDNISQLSNLEHLSLKHNRLSHISGGIGGCTQLQTLDISGNEIAHLPESIGQLTQLQTLNLSGNPLTELPVSMHEMTQLNQLHLWRTHLPTEQIVGLLTSWVDGGKSVTESIHTLTQSTVFEAPTLESLTHAFRSFDKQQHALGLWALCTIAQSDAEVVRKTTTLSLKKHALNTLPESILIFTRLQELNLQQNNLQSLPTTLGALTHLKVLNLRKNPLYSIPSNLHTMSIDRTQWEGLYETICHSSVLTHLDLSRNSIRSLPDDIQHLSQLRSLNLQYNRLTDLPACLSNLTTLETLNIRNNRFTTTPTVLMQMNLSGEIDLRGNPLKVLSESPAQIQLDKRQWNTVQDDIPKLAQLTHLTLHGCALEEWPECAFPPQLTSLNIGQNQIQDTSNIPNTLSNLTHLNLYRNQISRLSPDIGTLTNLTHLTLHYNVLTELPEELSQLTSLTHLDVAANSLKEIPECLSALTQLTHLNLRWNEIIHIPEWLGQMTQLRQLNLEQNPLSEDTQERLKRALPNCDIILGTNRSTTTSDESSEST